MLMIVMVLWRCGQGGAGAQVITISDLELVMLKVVVVLLYSGQGGGYTPTICPGAQAGSGATLS